MADMNWNYEAAPDWDKSGTVAESWYARIGRYVCRIDRFQQKDGGGWAYTIELNAEDDGIPYGDVLVDNASANSFEDAEQAICAIAGSA